jgi:tRNA modification GTPase
VARELTARGWGAIRVLALEGPGALERVGALAGRPGLVPGNATLLRLRDARGAPLDEVLALIEGEERLELCLHASRGLLERVIEELGARTEEPGAETLEERAELALARAPSEAAARMLLDQSGGALRRELEALLALRGPAFLAGLARLHGRARTAAFLVRPPVVVLAGPVNAGKSTLFNLLLGDERALVDPRPGTTRDALRARARLGAYAIDLVDTAGERALEGDDARSALERAGQELSRDLCSTADLVLWLTGAGSAEPSLAGRRALLRVITSCADRLTPAERERAPLPISVLEAPDQARLACSAVLLEALALPERPWRPGEGVPFEPGMERELEAWVREGDEAGARAGLEGWLHP